MSAAQQATGRGTHILSLPTCCIPAKCRRKGGGQEEVGFRGGIRGSCCELAESCGFTGSLERNARVLTLPVHTFLRVHRNVRRPASFRKQEQDFQSKMVRECFLLSAPCGGGGALEMRYTSSRCGRAAPPDTKRHHPAFSKS